MHPTTYSRAADSKTAVASIASSDKAKFLGGGTTLVDLMKLHVESPAALIDVSKLADRKIEAGNGGILIGAAASNTAVANDATVLSKFPVLSQAILSGATQQIRNMATVGGNLLQRVRCPYFRDGISACNKRSPGSGCGAKGGVETSLAVLGTSESCYATHPSDMAVALVALDAVVRVIGPKGPREIPIGEFHTLPGNTPHIESTLARDELITGIFIPDSPRSAKSLYLKMRDRASYEFAMASCAAAIETKDGAIVSSRLALGGVGTKPWRCAKAERVLLGKPSDALYNAVADAALKDAQPLAGNAYKVQLAKLIVVKTLKSLCP